MDATIERLYAIGKELAELSELHAAKALLLNRVGIWTWNIAPDTFDVDDTMCHIYGLSKERAKEGYKLWISLVHPEDRSEVEKILNFALKDSRNKYFAKFRINRKGVYRWVLGIGHIIRDANNNPIKIIGLNFLRPETDSDGAAFEPLKDWSEE